MDHETHVNGAPQNLPALNPPYEHPRNEAMASTVPLHKGHLGRRTFLRGVGTAIALPWLDAMVPRTARAASAAAKPPLPPIPEGRRSPAPGSPLPHPGSHGTDAIPR